MSTPCYCAMLRAATRRLGAAYDAVLEPFGINIAQFSLLRSIARRQPVSLTELGEAQQLDRSTIGRNVRVLERMGLAVTRRSDDDQREQVASLTQDGVALLESAIPVWEQCQRELSGRLGPERIDALQDILRSI